MRFGFGMRRDSGRANALLATGPELMLLGANATAAQWSDASPNARHYTQGTPANQPTVAGGIVTFDGSVTGGQGYNGPASIGTLVGGRTALTVAILMRRTSRATSTQYPWRFDIDSAMAFVSGANETARFYVNGTGNYTQVTPGDLLNVWRRWIYRFDQSQATDALRGRVALNGVNQSVTTVGSLNAAIATISTSQVGLGATGAAGLRGDVAAYLVWGRALSDLEVSAVDSSLAGIV